MRIACVFAPHVPLQALVRRRPELRKQAVAVVSGVVSGGPASTVLACSRAAYTMGVRVGMTAIAARQQSQELLVELRDLEAETQLEAAMVEAFYGISARVEAEGLRRGMKLPPSARVEPALPGSSMLFAEVPTGMRGATFGGRVLELAAALDVAVRVGIADDRFTAWVAARHGGQVVAAGGQVADEVPVVAVPRGGSAAFLAPQPLSLLDISPEVQQMLVMLGVRTLGEFASLPAPSVARRWDCDLQALARGEGGAMIHAVKPLPGPLREDVAIGGEGGLALGAAVAVLAERVALRLAGRGGVASAMEVTLHGAGGVESSTLWLVPPLHQAEALADRIGRAVGGGVQGSLGGQGGAVTLQRLGVAVTVGVPASVSAPHEVEGSAGPGEKAGEVVSAAGEGGPGSVRPAQVAMPSLEEALSEPVTMSGALLRWSEAASGLAHRRTRRGKQRRRVVSAQARLFGAE